MSNRWTHPLGHPKNRMSDHEVEDKFRRLAAGKLGPSAHEKGDRLGLEARPAKRYQRVDAVIEDEPKELACTLIPLPKLGVSASCLINRPSSCPGAFNALTAMQIERAGFHALYVSGAGLSATRGLPDIGLLSLTEVVSDAATITKAVTIPAIVDADTGFGPSRGDACREGIRAGWVGRDADRRSRAAQEMRTSAGEAVGLDERDGEQDLCGE